MGGRAAAAETDTVGDDRASTLAGRYRIGDVVSSDPRREVHDGYDVVLRRRVSLIRARRVDPGAPMPAPEPAALSPCPGVARVFDGGTWGGRLTFVTETIPAPPLADRLGRGRRCDRVTVLDVGARVARVLATLHARGVAHGALTPEHVVLTPDGPVLTEVGLGGVLTRWTGTPPERRYRPPERAGGPVGSAGPADDVYALGRVLRDAAPRRGRFDADVEDLLHRMTRTDPAARPRMVAVAETLAAARARLAHDGPGPARRRVHALTGAAAGLVAASCAAAVLAGGPAPSVGATVPPGAALAIGHGQPGAGAPAAVARSVPGTGTATAPAVAPRRPLPRSAPSEPAVPPAPSNGEAADRPVAPQADRDHTEHDAEQDADQDADQGTGPGTGPHQDADADSRSGRADRDEDRRDTADRRSRHGSGRDGADGDDRPDRSEVSERGQAQGEQA